MATFGSRALDHLQSLLDVARRHGLRMGTLVASYLVTSVVTLGAIFVLRREVTAPVLQAFLSFIFISAMASGLEPGTSKALLLKSRGEAPEGFSLSAVLAASAAKGLVAALPLGYMWWLTDPALPVAVFAWTAPVVILGFWATDVRVLLDWQGRHGEAIWAKQGGLSIGVVGSALALGFGVGVGGSLCLAIAMRCVWLAFSLSRCGLGPGRASLGRQVAGLLKNPSWIQLSLSSAVAALSGSADRLVALRYLPAMAAGGYIMLYEGLSKFWLIPYLAGPIIFARRVRGARSERVMAMSMLGVVVLGAGFMGVYAAAVLGFPALVEKVVRIPLGPASLLFPLAIVLSAAAQILNADLQARGYTRYVFGVAIGVLAATYGLFWVLAPHGLNGLFIAWAIKSAVELSLCILPGLISGRRLLAQLLLRRG